MSIRSAAELTHTSPSAWQRYESGDAFIGFEQAIELSKLMGCGLNLNDHANLNWIERIETGLKVVGSNPYRGIEYVISAIFEIQRTRAGLTENEYRWGLCQGHAVLGQLIISCGDHALAGQAFAASYNIGKREDFNIVTYDNVFLSTVWNGFTSARNIEAATQRLDWLERQMLKITLEERAKYPMLRCIFAGWAERPDLAFRIIEEFKKSNIPDDEVKSASLVNAWLMVKYGDPERAIQIAEQWMDSENQNVKLAAHKFAFEAFVRMRDINQAQLQFYELLKIENQYGIWSPGITSKVRKQFEC